MDELSSDDWILAMHPDNNLILGARKWNGENTDVPVMGTEANVIGDDGFIFDCNVAGTCDYLAEGQVPLFAIWDDSEQASLRCHPHA